MKKLFVIFFLLPIAIFAQAKTDSAKVKEWNFKFAQTKANIIQLQSDTYELIRQKEINEKMLESLYKDFNHFQELLKTEETSGKKDTNK